MLSSSSSLAEECHSELHRQLIHEWSHHRLLIQRPLADRWSWPSLQKTCCKHVANYLAGAESIAKESNIHRLTAYLVSRLLKSQILFPLQSRSGENSMTLTSKESKRVDSQQHISVSMQAWICNMHARRPPHDFQCKGIFRYAKQYYPHDFFNDAIPCCLRLLPQCHTKEKRRSWKHERASWSNIVGATS